MSQIEPKDHGTTEPPRDFRLGVLFVHGIGAQRWGDTLVRWGDALVLAIADATRSEAVAVVSQAGHGPADDAAAEAHLTIETGGRRERWLLREGWWAESFPPPTYGELVSWSLRAVPWAVALHFARGYWQETASGTKSATLLAFIRAGVKLFIMLPFTPIIVLMMALGLVLGLLPPLRGWVLEVQSALTSTMGDTLAFVESPVRAALIRTRILEQLTALAARCDRTIIVAHSQGAAAVLDALGGIAGDEEAERRSKEPSERPALDTLVTFGAGINQLVSLRVVSAGRTPALKGGGSAFAVMAFAAGVAAAMAWLAWKVATAQTTVAALFLGLAFYGVTLLTTIGLAVTVGIAIDNLKGWPRLKRHGVWLALSCFFGSIAGFSYLGNVVEPWGIDSDSVTVPFLAVVMLVASIGELLSRKLERSVKQHVRRPPGLGRWIDIHASSDPVPNGATSTGDEGVPEDVPVWNRGSILTDHTTYWENLDGFVLRVVAACAATAGSPWAAALAHDGTALDARATWRVGFLRLARASTLALWAALGALLFAAGLQSAIPVPFDLPTWIPKPAAAPALLALLLVCGAWASHVTVFAIWRVWVRSEQRAALAREAVTRRGFVPLFGMGMVVWMTALAVLGLAWNAFADTPVTLEAYQIPMALPVFSLVPAGLSVLGLLRLTPPPLVRGATREPVEAPVESIEV